MSIDVGTNSWITLVEADTYFTDERYDVEGLWIATTDAAKSATLIQAYRDLNAPGLFSFPTTATDEMGWAQSEQALMYLQQGSAVDRRLALQAQGVTKAGIFKEEYRPYDQVASIILAPRASGYLGDLVNADYAYLIYVARDEDATT